MEKETAVQRGSAAPRVSLLHRCDDTLLSLGRKHAKVMLGVRIAFRAVSAALVVFFGMTMLTLVGVAGMPAFFEAAFSGLTLQMTSPAFFNGTVAAVVLLLVAYGALTLLMVSASRILCDAAALFTLFFSLTIPMYQFPDVVAPVALVYALWFVHRVVLGTVVFRYRKLTIAAHQGA
ncbi:hypothetical protein [Eggerthella sinensis]|uniref:hypothetical protein n=1 Tax=Eggerthella sinensis TaxID=242230 RepID=UPI00248EA40C|nr:hypothetical protein [Eggerthella sinensis]